MKIVTNNDFIGMAQVLGVPAATKSPHLEGLISKTGVYESSEGPVIFSGDGFGEVADSIKKKGGTVYGLTAWTDNINTDLKARIKLATAIGMKIPEFKVASSIGEMDDLCASGWVALTKTIALKRTHGLSLTVEAFYKFGKFRNYFVKLTGDRLLYGNVGPMVPNALTCIFSMPNPALKKWFIKLAEVLYEQDHSYLGPVTMSGIVFGDECIFEDIKFGYDYDFELAKNVLCGPAIIVGEGPVPKGYASTIRMYDIDRGGLRIKGSGKYIYPLHCCENRQDHTIISSGFTPVVVVGVGDKIGTSYANAYEELSKIKTQELCYRSDGGRYAVEWWKKAKAARLI